MKSEILSEPGCVGSNPTSTAIHKSINTVLLCMKYIIKTISWLLVILAFYTFAGYVVDNIKETKNTNTNWGIAKDSPVR